MHGRREHPIRVAKFVLFVLSAADLQRLGLAPPTTLTPLAPLACVQQEFLIAFGAGDWRWD